MVHVTASCLSGTEKVSRHVSLPLLLSYTLPAQSTHHTAGRSVFIKCKSDHIILYLKILPRLPLTSRTKRSPSLSAPSLTDRGPAWLSQSTHNSPLCPWHSSPFSFLLSLKHTKLAPSLGLCTCCFFCYLLLQQTFVWVPPPHHVGLNSYLFGRSEKTTLDKSAPPAHCCHSIPHLIVALDHSPWNKYLMVCRKGSQIKQLVNNHYIYTYIYILLTETLGAAWCGGKVWAGG